MKTNLLTRLFGFNPQESSIRIEIIAGTTTFLTMAYILTVNPIILSSTGMDSGAVFTATALASSIATIIMALIAKIPLAQAPAMGVNTFFAYTIVAAMGYSWQTALTTNLVAGFIYVILSVFNIRKTIVEAIPASLRAAIPVGIGFFIAFVGLQNAGIIVNNEATLVTIGDINTSTAIAFLSILLSGVFMYNNVKGGVLLSILICTVIALVTGVVQIPENFSIISFPASIEPIFLKFDFKSLLNWDIILIIILLVFVDIFDTIGTVVSAVKHISGDKIDPNSKKELPRTKEVLISDAIGTVVGSALGTPMISPYVESMSGIVAGGKSGLAGFTTGILFLLSLFLAPLFLLTPSIATTGALVSIGVLMMASIKEIDLHDISEALPVLLTILIMLLSYSIAEGIAIGIIFYTLTKVCTKQRRQVTNAQYAITAILIARYIFI